MTVAADPTRVRCTACGATADLILKHNRQGFLTHAWLPKGWRQIHTQTLCPDCPGEEASVTSPDTSTELEVIAHLITQTIYSMPFDLASRLQQEQALTCARKILTTLSPERCETADSEVAA